jgi:23S rRNA (adenine2503-C2)-methyltransferase
LVGRNEHKGVKVPGKKKDMRLQSSADLEKWFAGSGHPLYRMRQLHEWIWKKNITDLDLMSDLPPALREELGSQFEIGKIKIKEQFQSCDGATKFVFELTDKNIIESVLILEKTRTTACISTQVGCPLGCRFCATGKMRFQRDLHTYEIYDQFMVMNSMSTERFGHGLNNVVYMGMGEPLLNYRNTLDSVYRLTDRKYGPGLSPQRITISTSGIPMGIKTLAEEQIRVQLAVSLHSAIEEKRIQLMPLAQKYALEELSEALKYFHAKTRERITIEYLLLGKFNDEIKDAAELASWCRAFPVKINLITYNPSESNDFEKSEPEQTRKFRQFLLGKNMIVNIRASKGNDIAAACGQLAGRVSKIKATGRSKKDRS